MSHHQRALHPVEPEPGVLVHTGSDRRLAVEQWLLATAGARDRARMEWREAGLAFLPLGTLFSAIRIPQTLVAAIVGGTSYEEADELLADALKGGPVICDPRQHRYYALVPASMPTKWTVAAEEWRALGVECLGRGWYLGVPRVDMVDLDPEARLSYWSVPMPSAGELCSPLTVARLLAAGKRCLAEAEAEAEADA